MLILATIELVWLGCVLYGAFLLAHTSEPGANDPAVRVVDSSHSSSSTGINWMFVLALLVLVLFWLDVALAVAAAV
jgi:hypothetical protein